MKGIRIVQHSSDKKLWSDWQKHYERIGISPEGICQDGIIDIATYNKAKVKILFILKDVNDWPSGDLRDMLKKGPVDQIWHAVARWASGLLLGFPSFSSIDTKQIMTQSIQSVAVINLKKYSGYSSIGPRILNAFAKNDHKLLLAQINMIKPDLIIACGTFDPLIWLLDLDVDPLDPWAKPVIAKRLSAWVVPFRHPTMVNNRITYSSLKKLCNSIIQGLP
jgi:hypothetical protein